MRTSGESLLWQQNRRFQIGDPLPRGDSHPRYASSFPKSLRQICHRAPSRTELRFLLLGSKVFLHETFARCESICPRSSQTRRPLALKTTLHPVRCDGFASARIEIQRTWIVSLGWLFVARGGFGVRARFGRPRGLLLPSANRGREVGLLRRNNTQAIPLFRSRFEGIPRSGMIYRSSCGKDTSQTRRCHLRSLAQDRIAR